MANRKLLLIVIASVVILSCLYETVQANAKNRSRDDATELTRSLFRDIEVVSKQDNVGTIGFITCIIGFVLRAVTYPVRTIYKLVFNLVAAVALMMLGCRVIPVVRCFEQNVNSVMDEIMKGVEEELHFFASFDSTPDDASAS